MIRDCRHRDVALGWRELTRLRREATVDAALAGLAVLATAVMVASALVRFFAALDPDPGEAVRARGFLAPTVTSFLHSSGSSGPGLT